MTINAAYDLFKNLITEAQEKSEVKVYNKFIAILTDLESKVLTNEQLQSIEKELDTLDLNVNAENKKKHFKHKLTKFIKFLKKTFSLITEGYYTAIGMSLGMSFGVAFGAAFSNVSLGLIIGMLIGLIVGASMDSKAKKDGKVLKTKLN
jgi:hypothetical protein